MKTILLADDSITIQKVVELTFSDGEYQVVCVSNGAQALKKMPEVRPDIVLLDVIMPERNGYEVCEQMKADPALSRIPVLLLTGTFEPFDRRRAEAAGASGHLTKPFESHTLVGRVEELLAQGPISRPPVPAPVTQAATQAPPRPATTPASAAPTAAESMPASPAASIARPPVMQAPAEPAPMPVPPHPAFAPPDAAAGGSYLGFGDLGIDDAEEPVVPDRFDDVTPGSSTVRISRGDTRVLPVSPAPVEVEEEQPPSGPAGATMEGFMPGYEIPEGMQRPVTPAESGRPKLHDRPDPGRMEPPAARPAADQADLSDESLERLADLVVRKMSERVVREIAWEVIPGVAEALVRQRIRELEENER